MRVAFVSYPIAFQAQGGVAIQMLETMAALARLGIDARLFDARSDLLTDFDIVHVFAAIHGNHVIIEWAKNLGVPVVLSPILSSPVDTWHALASSFCERLTGRLTRWAVRTSYGQIGVALQGADRIVVLGQSERQIVMRGYGINADKIRIVPNGISAEFFAANPKPFLDRHKPMMKVVLCVAFISPYKNQLGLIEALRNEPYDIVLVGECLPNDRAYLNQCLSLGKQKVHYLGSLDHDDPMLASAYAAADVMALVSKSECAPLAALESLAAGTPVVLTKKNSLDLEENKGVVAFVDPGDPIEIRDAIVRLLDRQVDGGRCAAAVAALTWDAVAKQLLGIYSDVIRQNETLDTQAVLHL